MGIFWAAFLIFQITVPVTAPLPDLPRIDIHEAVEVAEAYVKTQGYAGLEAEEVFQFRNNYYEVEFVEEETHIHALELLVNPVTREVVPEMGPNVDWNTKYGKGVAPEGAVAMPLEKARELVLAVLENGSAFIPETVLDPHLLALGRETEVFHGYYEFHILYGGEPITQINVNAYTGETFVEAFHGPIVRSLSLHEDARGRYLLYGFILLLSIALLLRLRR